MFKHIKKLLNEFSAPSIEKPAIDFNSALAALMVEVMRSDGKVLAVELKKIEQLLRERCELEPDQITTLITTAQELVEQAIDLYIFIKQVNNHTDDVERIEIVQLLWYVAYADGNIDSYEDHIIRKISGLMYVTHADFIAAKLAAKP
ncbi:hypothetical protein PCIT_a3684 [Pseudoalteromonas citrea]|uniref:Co-chaperone DjlA N-terminal domain-containing protein n=2 Tax=Pseudoalteromonas citrea TaxID=43655 RepID=A0AAD4AG55_9GAMM|nr:TerB family tellurite resistance protein [Pseudoalteromonas citrea]KAF7767630.1 hypothetical protein PCIT_a3684 [Pseudoalteromonas citrea]